MKNCRDVEPLLASYVDGDAAPEDRAAVDAHVAVCGDCRDDLGAQGAARDLLQARREKLRDAASPQLRARCAAQASVSSGSSRKPQRLDVGSHVVASAFRRKVPLAAAATILLALSTVFGLGLNDKVQALAVQMTIDHVKCARFNSSATAADPVMAAQQWLAKAGWPLTVPASSVPAGLELRAVRRCGVTDGRVAHLIYDWRGEPLSVYVLNSRTVEGTAQAQRFGHDSVMWSQNGRTYVVLARTSRRDELAGVVQYMRSNVY
jgi:anti-sigma factor RsiW